MCKKWLRRKKIILEKLLREKINVPVREMEVYCFSGLPKIFVNVRYGNVREITVYNEKYNIIDLVFHPDKNNLIKNEKADDYINQTFDGISMELISILSAELSKEFNFVRVDWIILKNKLYFNELTFSPYSGFIKFDKTWNKKLGQWIKI